MLSPLKTTPLFELGFTLYLLATLEELLRKLNYLAFSNHRLGLTRKILFKIKSSLLPEHLAHFIVLVLKFVRVCGNSPISVL